MSMAGGNQVNASTESTSPYKGLLDASRVLVVDDEDVIGMVLTNALAEEFSVAVAISAEEALDVIAAHPPDVVLLDKNLPGMSGLELLKTIKRDLPQAEVILITAYASIESVVEALRLGACDYLIKPFPHLRVVVEKVRWARNRKRLMIERLQLVNRLLAINEELRRTMEDLRQSEGRARALFNAISDVLFVNDIALERGLDRFLDLNEPACTTLGYTRTELLSKSLRDLLPPHQHQVLNAIKERLLAERNALFETEFVSKTGITIPVEVHSQLFEHHGQTMVLSVARNRSHRV
jgi:PAS domain S-box-containing protein